jgi:hypothetical protein
MQYEKPCECECFDHIGEANNLCEVTLKPEYGGCIFDWCEECRRQNYDIIQPVCEICFMLTNTQECTHDINF